MIVKVLKGLGRAASIAKTMSLEWTLKISEHQKYLATFGSYDAIEVVNKAKQTE